jgi:hypothetical protein
MTSDRELNKLQRKITSLKEMKKTARLLTNKRNKLRLQLTEIRKGLNKIRFKLYRIKNKSTNIK